VANDGTLVARQLAGVGFGDVVAIYASDGSCEEVRLADLLPAAAIEKIDRNVPSICGRCVKGDPGILPNVTLQIEDTSGGRFTFQLESGAYTYEAGVAGCKP
jgi:hypothetical protein